MPRPVYPRIKSTRRRALELLSASREGCTEAIMLAHGFTVPQMVELIRAGLASAHTERVPKLIQGVTFTDGIEVAVNPASSRSQTAAA